ncbi:MAG: 6-phosphogluconolactonase [Ignavibacteriales bacterium]|nr:6-phosphogluconolactonase [Ignavibacteriales bacterium]
MSLEKRSFVTVYKDTSELEHNAAKEIARIMTTAINDRGVCFVALSGGETPRQIYRRLGMEPIKDQVNWNSVHLFFSDERSVSPNDAQSNYGMVERSLLSWIDIPRQNVHRLKGELDPLSAAEEYEADIRSAFGDKEMRFDLVLLGVGEDGHVASIFPGTRVVDEEVALVRPAMNPSQPLQRITLTFPIINSAREILFLVSGKRKASIVQRVLATSKPTRDLPATMVRPAEGSLRWMIDHDAASQIDPTIDVIRY